MHPYRLLVTCVAVLLFTNTHCLADVEDILQSQAELLESEKNNTSNKKVEDPKNATAIGRQEFIDNCALCHGDNAKGDGPFSKRLAKKPKDLTQIRANNKGEFPFRKIYETIDGRDETLAHGARTMPIWGDRFSSESWFKVSTEHAETLARGKILELLLYLESIQEY